MALRNSSADGLRRIIECWLSGCGGQANSPVELFSGRGEPYGSAVGADSTADTALNEARGLNNPSVFNRAAGGLRAEQLLNGLLAAPLNLIASSTFQAQAEAQKCQMPPETVLLMVDVKYFASCKLKR